MPINGYFDTIFASSGSTAVVPDAVQTDGSVSYTQGYGVNYTLNPETNPSALNIEQTKFNQILYDITSAIQYLQQGNAATFITPTMNGGSAYSYPLGAVVQYSGIQYVSLVASNTDTPPTAKWGQITKRRILLTANSNFYVATTGNDSTGTGTSSLPWLTIQHAINYIQSSIDLGGFNAIINVANGTYTGQVSITEPFTGGGVVQLLGNPSSPSSCIISTTSQNAIYIYNTPQLSISGFQIQTATAGNGIDVSGQGFLQINGPMVFGACAGSHIQARNGGLVYLESNYTVSGNAALAHFAASDSSQIAATQIITVTNTGNPSFGAAYANSVQLSDINLSNVTFSGAATGVRYNVANGGLVYTNGGGANFVPGSSAGTNTNGFYA